MGRSKHKKKLIHEPGICLHILYSVDDILKKFPIVCYLWMVVAYRIWSTRHFWLLSVAWATTITFSILAASKLSN